MNVLNLSPLSKARSEAHVRSVFCPPATALMRSVPAAKKTLAAGAMPWSPEPSARTTAGHHHHSNGAASGAPKPPAPLHLTPPATPVPSATSTPGTAAAQRTTDAADPSSTSPAKGATCEQMVAAGAAVTSPVVAAAAPLREVRAPPPALGQSPNTLRPAVAALSPEALGALPPASAGSASGGSPALLRSSLDSGGPVMSFTPASALSCSIFTPEAMATGVYTGAMLQHLRRDAGHTPRRILAWVLDMYRAAPHLRVPPHLLLAVGEPGIDDALLTERGYQLGSSLKNAKRNRRPVRQIQHKVMSVLSRVTPQKYSELQKELLELPLKQTDDNELKEVVRVFFEKAVQEQTFSALYANLVADVCKVSDQEKELEREVRDKLLAYRMRRELLSTCQEEFQRPLQLSVDDKVDPLTGKPLEDDEIDFKRDRLKSRLCGNIKFVGELYKQRLVTDRVIGQVLRILVGNYDERKPTEKESYVFEVFATLLKTAGVQCRVSYPEVLAEMMEHVKRIEVSHPVARVRFQMMDLQDMAKKGWEVSKRDKLMTTEEREKDHYDTQRKQLEEVDRLARQRQQALSEQQMLATSSPAAFAGTSPSARPGQGGKHAQQQQQQLSASSPTTPSYSGHHQLHHPQHFHHHHHIHHGPGGPMHFNPMAMASPVASSPKHPYTAGFGALSASGLPPPPPPPLPSPGTSQQVTPSASPAKKQAAQQPHTPHGPPPASPTTASTPPPPRYAPRVAPTAAVATPTAKQLPTSHSGSALFDATSMPGRSASTSSLNALQSPSRASNTPLTPAAPPALHVFAEQLMSLLASTKSADEVLLRLLTVPAKQRTHILMHWLRRVTTITKLFNEREQICTLFSALLLQQPTALVATADSPSASSSAASGGDVPLQVALTGPELASCFMEWLRCDIESGQHDSSPRFFSNLMFVIQKAHEPKLDPTGLSRSILSCGALNVMGRELCLNDQAAGALALVRECLPLVATLMPDIASAVSTPKELLLRALENRFRVLPFLLGFSASSAAGSTSAGNMSMVSAGSGSDIFVPATPDSANGAGMFPSVGASAIADPLAAVLANAKLNTDPELALFRLLKESEDAAAWRATAVALMALPTASAASPAPHLLCTVLSAMKAAGAMLACLFPSAGLGTEDVQPAATGACTDADVDDVVRMARRTYAADGDAQLLFDAAVLGELVTFFTATAESISTPLTQGDSLTATFGGSSRLEQLLVPLLVRWASTGVMPVAAGLQMLATITDPTCTVPMSPSTNNGSLDVSGDDLANTAPAGTAAAATGTSPQKLLVTPTSLSSPSMAAVGPGAGITHGPGITQGITIDLFTVYHNFMCDPSWRLVMQRLLQALE